MTKCKTALLGISAAFLCGIGVAQAQDYYSRADEVTTYPERVQVIAQPGKLSALPLAVSVTRDVRTADLDLSRASGQMGLDARIHDTARELCAQLDVRFPELDRDRSCVRDSVRNATFRDGMG